MNAPVTFFRDVEPILQRRCQDCHRPGEVAGFSLLTYDESAAWARTIKRVVGKGRMPPWGASPEYGHFRNDRRMTDEEKSTLLEWIDLGTPAGDPTHRPPPRNFRRGWRIPEPDLVLELPEPVEIPADGILDYEQVVFDHVFEKDVLVRAVEFRPGVREVVHHIMAFIVPPNGRSGWDTLDGGKMGYFALMAPGCEPTVFPEGMAKRIPAGSRMQLVIHYQPNGIPTVDRTRIGLVFADEEEVTREVFTESAYNNSFVLPPGVAHTPVSAVRVLDRETTIISLNPHMHYRGAAWRYEVFLSNVVPFDGAVDLSKLPVVMRSMLQHDPKSKTLRLFGPMNDAIHEAMKPAVGPAGYEALAALRRGVQSRVLLDVPRYDFGWQDTYWLDEPLTLPAGTLILCTGIFDNSTGNPWLDEELAAQTVKWGEQSADEMMQGYYDYYYADGSRESQAQRDREFRARNGLPEGALVIPHLGASSDK